MDGPRAKAPLLFRPVDISSLVFFRVAYGAVMLWEVWRYLGQGWVERYYIAPEFHFRYQFFEWVHPWPGVGMHVHFWAMAFLSFCVIVGFMYRLSAALLWLAFTYVFLLEQAKYLNHFYLVSLLGFLMVLVPAHHAWSLDARSDPSIRSQTTPFWAVLLLRFQVGVPYFFGGIAKCTHDWLHGEPMRDWLAPHCDFPLFGRFFEEEWMVYLFSYSGLLIDLLAVPFLLVRRTRAAMMFVLVLFHFTNTRLFNIGIFPWFMLGATTIFCRPDWPRRLFHATWVKPSRQGTIVLLGGAVGAVGAAFFHEEVELFPVAVGAAAVAVTAWLFAEPRFPTDPPPAAEPPPEAARRPGRAIVQAFLFGWILIQVTLPLRHYLIPGNVHWTEDGHRFSWHMKLRDKDGSIQYAVKNPTTGEVLHIDPGDELESWQLRKLATRPYMVRQYAHHLAETVQREQGWDAPEVYCQSLVSLNGRARQALIDPNVDLAAEPFPMGRTPWLIPLPMPLVAPVQE